MSDIVITSTSNLDKELVEDILKDYVEEKTGKFVDSLRANIVDGNFVGFIVKYEDEIPEEVVINNKEEKPKRNIKIDTTFRPWVIE
jgi:hypothetical protein